MNLLPKKIRSQISAKEITNVENWWEKLSPENQKNLESLYLQEDEKAENTISIYLCGKFVEQERPDDRDIFWVNHLYNFIVNHELKLYPERRFVSGGICSANLSAQEAIKSGFIPKGFNCPEKKKNCLMLNVLHRNPGKSVKLYVEFKLE